LSIGQGTLTATPLQIARLLSTIANGGRLVRPHVRQGDSNTLIEPIAGLHAPTLQAIAAGLVATVADPRGTAHDALGLDTVAVAGKTGTAQCGPGQPDHAWFAGYLPAERPQWAVVVVLEHAGDAATAAAPLARRVILQMQELGLLGE
jgi:penicillin-binding protein 2